MIKLLDKPNIIAADGDYPFGRPRDNDGSGNGTPYNELVFNDYMQFFEKLMDLAQVTPNGLRENEYNGFQLNQALINMIIGRGSLGIGTWIAINLSGGSFTNVGGTYYNASARVNLYRGMIELRGVLRFPDVSGPYPPNLHVGQIELNGGIYPDLDEECLVEIPVMTSSANLSRVGGEVAKITRIGDINVPVVTTMQNLNLISLDNICIPLTTGNLNILP